MGEKRAESAESGGIGPKTAESGPKLADSVVDGILAENLELKAKVLAIRAQLPRIQEDVYRVEEAYGRALADNAALKRAIREAKADRDALRRMLRRVVDAPDTLPAADLLALTEEAEALLAAHPYEESESPAPRDRAIQFFVDEAERRAKEREGYEGYDRA